MYVKRVKPLKSLIFLTYLNLAELTAYISLAPKKQVEGIPSKEIYLSKVKERR
jgi:hypothetical protein